MEELREKANCYAEENVINVLKEAFAKVYADGYRDGYNDRDEMLSIDLRGYETEYVDLGLPSGTLWSTDYEKEDDKILYVPYQKANNIQIPTEELWKELIDNCKWQGDYSSSGQSFYGIVCIGPNGNSIRFYSKGYMQDNKKIGLPLYGGGQVYFWIIDEREGNYKKALNIYSGGNRSPEIEITKVFSGYKLPVRLVKSK